MYEWSDDIISKIENANCLNEKELRMVEMILRTYDVYEDIMDESIGLSGNDRYKLKHKIKE